MHSSFGRRPVITTLAIITARAIIVWASSATWSTGGAITIKYSNFDMGTVYNVAPGSYGTSNPATGQTALNALPQTPATASFGGEDSWGIAVVASIEDGTNVPTLTIFLHLAKVLGVPATSIIEEMEGSSVETQHQAT